MAESVEECGGECGDEDGAEQIKMLICYPSMKFGHKGLGK